LITLEFKKTILQSAIFGGVLFFGVSSGIKVGLNQQDISYDSQSQSNSTVNKNFQAANIGIPKTLQNLFDKSPRNKLIDSFEVSESGVVAKGWLVDLGGTQQLYWSFGEFVVAGALVGSDGINLTDKFISDKSPGLNPALWSQLTSAMHIQASPTVNPNVDNALYVFYEPFCGACSALMNRLIPLMLSNEIDVRLIPVAWLSPDSPGAIQALVDGKSEALAIHEKLKQSGKKVPTADATPETKASIIRNGDLMSAMGVTGTPAVIYKDASGKVINLGVASDSELSEAIRVIKSRG
jgi:thiol:disulfide interchange protein DsbG